jgi:hypothetical protein
MGSGRWALMKFSKKPARELKTLNLLMFLKRVTEESESLFVRPMGAIDSYVDVRRRYIPEKGYGRK